MIEAVGLGKRFTSSPTERKAVDDVSFTVGCGEFFVIMGLSGSGKSTLLRMLNRLVEPTEGSVRVDGVDVSALGEVELRDLRNSRINMVFQHFALFPHRTVRENAAYGLHVRGISAQERDERADAALTTVGLDEWGDAYPDELSGGMRQRVGLARALATDAEVLLMDEPFSALDPLIRREMQDLLLTLQHERQRTIVFVTHDLNEAMRLGDRIMVMRDGHVVQIGSGSTILSEPADDYVAEFVSDVDRSRVLTASTVMHEPLVTACVGDHPLDALKRVSSAQGCGLYVLADDGSIVGVATLDDLAGAARMNADTLAPCITDEFDAVDEATCLSTLFPLIGRHTVPLAVTGVGGRLVGVIPRAAVLAALSEKAGLAHV
ncbi:quaternary amine ABC transporter ATP-binding protein [Pseudonocardia phyllosphaerae]|uniref:quaternary amine ABC transporter ATP-binding protein n=1 Tax=Pseudonocardia phyllosphaerae TaxID=3390502 RepID=UPI00397B2C8E